MDWLYTQEYVLLFKFFNNFKARLLDAIHWATPLGRRVEHAVYFCIQASATHTPHNFGFDVFPYARTTLAGLKKISHREPAGKLSFNLFLPYTPHTYTKADTVPTLRRSIHARIPKLKWIIFYVCQAQSATSGEMTLTVPLDDSILRFSNCVVTTCLARSFTSCPLLSSMVMRALWEASATTFSRILSSR